MNDKKANSTLRPTAKGIFRQFENIEEVPVNKIRFEQLTVKEVSPSPEFRSIRRDNKQLRQAYLDVKDGPDVKYRVKHNLLEKKITRNLTINSKRKVFGKTVSKMPPACISDKAPCTYEKRMLLTNMRRTSEAPQLSQEALTTNRSNRQHEMKVEDMGEQTINLTSNPFQHRTDHLEEKDGL